MKKLITTIAIFIFALVLSNDAFGQRFRNLDKSPLDIIAFPLSNRISDKVVKITYSRPYLKGRSLSELAPEGKKWRMGANEATTVTFYKNVTFGGKSVKAGTYTMYAIPGEKDWTIALSTQLNVWGAFSHKKENDVVRVKGKISKSDNNLENFSITFDKDMTLYMGWANTIVSIPIK